VERGADVARRSGLEAEPLARAARYGSHRRETAVWQEVLRTADELDAAAVVLGTRGRSTTRSLLLGSVSYGVVHQARRPVLIVPPARR
jgi:nucleotide-binding universal stress UspA family protein